MGMDIRLDLDLRELDKEFRKFNRRSRNLRPAFAKLAPFMEADQREHARLKEGPDGAWEDRAGSTKARHGRRSRILGRVASSFSVEFDRRELVSQSNVPFSLVHQKGGRVGNGAVLPSRVHRWMSNQFLNIAGPMIARHVFKGRP